MAALILIISVKTLNTTVYGVDVAIQTHQNEVRLISGQHEHRDVVVGQWRDDRLGDFGDSDGLRVGSVASP